MVLDQWRAISGLVLSPTHISIITAALIQVNIKQVFPNDPQSSSEEKFLVFSKLLSYKDLLSIYRV